ncbi:MAG: hypothetical protein ABIK31_04100 [candidate division WOR-3 bacterium]
MLTIKKIIGFSIILFSFTQLLYSQTHDTLLTYNPKGKAIIASALVPGWGQHILKHHRKSEIMLWADGTIWLLYAGFQWYGASRFQDSRLFASIYANANPNLRDEKYYRALERYRNADDYNEFVRMEARDRYPNDPSLQHSYYLEHGYFGDSAWSWQADSFRFAYWEKRKAARSALTKAGFCLGAAILNRLISVFDCSFFSVDLRNKVSVEANSDNSGIGLVFRF